MSAYTTQTAIQSRIAPADLLAALDDTSSGQFNTALLNTIIEVVSADIDGLLASVYATPFANPGILVQQACLAICCEKIYQRRLTPEENNIYAAEAKMWRKVLDDIAGGRRDLDAAEVKAFAPVQYWQQPMSTAGNSR